MDKRKKIRICAAAGILAAIAIVLVITKNGRQTKGDMGMQAKAAVTSVKAQKPTRGDIKLTTNLTGTVEPDVIHIYAKAAGDVTAVMVKAGDVVSPGQILFELDTEQVESAKNALDSASVSLSEAQSNLGRMQILHDSGDLSDQEYEKYSNAVKSARLQYDSAKLNYDRQVEYSTVTAPIGGTVEDCDIEVYDRVTQSQALCVIAGDGENSVSFYVTQRMMENIQIGDEVELQKNGTFYSAEISEISSMVDTDTGLFKVKAQVEDTQEIAAGSTVKLKLVTKQAVDAMLVPMDAIYYSGGNAYVYLYRDGQAATAQVEVGLEDSEHAQILSGIAADDMVVGTWSSNLYEGAKIRLLEEEMEHENASEGADRHSGRQTGEQTDRQVEQEA